MALLLKLAVRNLRRNFRRSLITSVSIALGLALLIVSISLQDGAYRDMIDAGVDLYAGHVVVQGEGYQEERDPQIVVPSTAEVERVAQRLVPGATVLERVFVDGLLTSPRGSTGVSVIGVSPEEERATGDLDERLVRGHYLGDDPTDIVIGATLADTLDVDVDEKLVLMHQSGGDIESQLFRVRGVFRTGSDELDGFLALVPLEAAQEITGIGEEVSQVAVYLPDIDDTEEVTARLRQALAARPVEVLPWMEALPQLYEYVLIDEAGGYIFLGIIALIVAIGILNTMLMSVLERMRELGMMLALGMSPTKLLGMVLLEAALLGTLAALFGLAVGGAASWAFAVYGLDYSALFGDALEVAGVVIDPKIYADISLPKWGLFTGLAIATAVLAGLYPAIKAARLTPLEAMHPQ